VRTGFTLIEVLIALVVFEFGMLALAAVAAVAARDLATASLTNRAHDLARNRVEQLRATACATGPGAGETSSGGITEFWRVDASGALRILSDSVDFTLPRRRRANIVLRARRLCP
jgi:type IV pilus modification protein PilV